MVGLRECCHMGIVRLDRLRTVRGCHRLWASFRATTYPNNGTDEPTTFFDSIVEARSQMRGQGAMQRGLGVSPVDLGYSPRKLGIPSTIEPCWERLTLVPPYPTWPVGWAAWSFCLVGKVVHPWKVLINSNCCAFEHEQSLGSSNYS